MAASTEHIALANVNHATLMYLLQDHQSHPEWIATIAFYKAVQIVEAVIALRNQHSEDHKSRLGRVKVSYPELFTDLNTLYGKSRIARYLHDGASSFRAHMTADQVVDHLVGKRLLRLEQLCVQNYLGGETALQLIHKPDLPKSPDDEPSATTE